MKYPTDEDLKRYSERVLTTTINMVFATALELYVNENAFQPHMRLAFMDSFRIHARSLLFFFYGTKPQPDDAIAQHFMHPGVEWSNVRGDQTPALSDLQRRVGKEVAHLTYARPFVNDDIIDWDMGTEMRDLYHLLQNFIRHADAYKLHANVPGAPERWLREFRRNGALKASFTGSVVVQDGK